MCAFKVFSEDWSFFLNNRWYMDTVKKTARKMFLSKIIILKLRKTARKKKIQENNDMNPSCFHVSKARP